MRKKILHIIDSLGRAGAETLLVGVINSLHEYEHHIVILNPKNDFVGELPSSVKITCLNHTSKWKLPLTILKLKSFIKDYKPDIVHSHLYWSSLIAKAATPQQVKLFFSNHTIQSNEAFKKWYYVFIEKATYKKHHNLISVSRIVEQDYNKIIKIKGKSYVLYNFIGDNWFNNSIGKVQNYDELHFIGVGRYDTPKNYPYLINNFPNKKKVTLDIFGSDGNQEIKKLIEKSSNTQISYKGISHNLISEYRNYNVFISTSIYEGFGIAVLEAMAQGLPVILSNIDVYKEVADYAGIFIDIKNPNSLKNLIEDIENKKIDLEYYSKMSIKRANEIAKREEYIQKLLKIYTD